MKLGSFLALSLLSVLSLHAQTADGGAALKPLRPDGFVTLEEIVGDFRSAPDAALQKYGGNEITVYGRVGSVSGPDSDAASGAVAVIYLQEFSNPTPDVKVLVHNDDLPENALIRVSPDGTQAIIEHTTRIGNPKGDTPYAVVDERVAFKGGFGGFQEGDILLNNAHKVPKKEIEAKLEGGASGN